MWVWVRSKMTKTVGFITATLLTTEFSQKTKLLTLFRMGLFEAACRWGKTPVPKICHIYPTMMKIITIITYLKNIEKYTYESRDAPLEFC